MDDKTSDIVHRLRVMARCPEQVGSVWALSIAEAADEIERLEYENRTLKAGQELQVRALADKRIKDLEAQCRMLRAEIRELRAELDAAPL